MPVHCFCFQLDACKLVGFLLVLRLGEFVLRHSPHMHSRKHTDDQRLPFSHLAEHLYLAHVQLVCSQCRCLLGVYTDPQKTLTEDVTCHMDSHGHADKETVHLL